jgi:glycolate oxidase
MVDHSISTIEVLAEVVEAVDGRAEVAIDSGFTRGAEICKALALGAQVVGIGRLQCWGLALGGAAGLTRVLEILDEEIGTTMANIGAATITDLTPDHVRWSIPAPPT